MSQHSNQEFLVAISEDGSAVQWDALQNTTLTNNGQNVEILYVFIPLFYYDLAKKYIFIWKQSLWKQTQLQLFGIGLDPLPNQIWILLLNSLSVLFDKFLQWWDRLSNPKWFYSPSTQNQFYIFKEKSQQ